MGTLSAPDQLKMHLIAVGSTIRRTRGPCVSLPATLPNSPYSLTAEVVEDAELVFLPRQRLLDLLRDQPHPCFPVMNILPEGLTPTRTALEGLRKAVC